MHRLLTQHTRAGHLGLRLLCLQLLWIGYTLRGAIVAGIFPATAAVHAILRADACDRELHPGQVPELRGLRAQFRDHWHTDFAAANRLGALLSALWAVVLLDRAAVTHLDMGALTPVLEGFHTIGGLLLGIITVLVWPLQAHFDDRAPALLRRATIMLLGRPAISLMTGLGVGIILYAYLLIPGLIPVFGIIAPAAIATASLWRTSTLAIPTPAPASPTASRPLAVGLAPGAGR